MSEKKGPVETAFEDLNKGVPKGIADFYRELVSEGFSSDQAYQLTLAFVTCCFGPMVAKK